MQPTSEKTDLLFQAIFKARQQFVKVLKDRQNTHLKNNYATLDSVLNTIEPPLTAAELWVEQSMAEDSSRDTVKVITTIRHSSGQWISYFTIIPVAKQDAQGVGSAFTYGRRYALAACFGLSQADDDAERSVLTAKDWKKRLDKCETLDDLTAEFANAWKASDQANRPVIQEHYDKIKAKLNLEASASNGGGFQPAPKATRDKVKREVETQRKEDVQSSPTPQSIDSFE